MEYNTAIHKRVKAKLHTVGGFSLAELMLTMFILSLMTALSAWGVPVVIHVYQRAVDTANAETYLNTTMIALRGRLCVASNVELKADKTEITYTDPKTGRCRIFRSNDENKEINIQEGLDMDSPPEANPLMSSGDDRFVSSYDTIDYTPTVHGGFFTITGLQVEKQTKQGEILATLETPYIIHTLNP